MKEYKRVLSTAPMVAYTYLDVIDKTQKWKNPMRKSPIIHWAMNKQKSVKTPYSLQNEILPPGKLFGNPLTQLSTEDETIPKPIQDILVTLFQKGPGTTGIFRKSAAQRTAKQIRQSLDTGKEVDIGEKSAIVLATVLKEFFRSLPESLICSEIFEDLCNTKTQTDPILRIESIKGLLQQLPKENYELIMHFMCLLYHIQRFSDKNNMNSYNLSVCVSPSIMKPPKDGQNKMQTQVEQHTGGSHDVLTFIIDNYVQVFSKENEYCLGPETDIHFDDGPGEDSDSGTDNRERDLSLDDCEDSDKELEPQTPEILFTPNIDSPFGQSDSSIGTNDSDELKHTFNRTNPPSIIVPDLNRSKSTPSSPLSTRRDEEMDSGMSSISYETLRNQSDMSDYDDHPECFQRNLLRQPRAKRVLSNNNTSTELIEHKRHMPDVSNKRNGGCYDIIPTEEVIDVAGNIVKKQVMDQPLVQHFATEYYAAPEIVAPAKPDIIFHTADKHKQRAAPSYEEHIQRTQSKHRPSPQTERVVRPAERIVQQKRTPQPVQDQPVKMAQAVRNPKLNKKPQVHRQSVEDYQPPKPIMGQVGNSSKHDKSSSKPKQHLSHLPQNFNNFMQNRKSKPVHRNSNGLMANEQTRSNSLPNRSPRDNNNQSDFQKQDQQSIAQLQNEHFENQVRNNELATQMREDILTTNNRNNTSINHQNESGNHSNSSNNNQPRFQRNSVERHRKEDASIRKSSDSDMKKEKSIVVRPADKTKVPRISVTSMSHRPNAMHVDEDTPQPIAVPNSKTDNKSPSLDSSNNSSVALSPQSADIITVPSSQTCKISREGRKAFRSSTKLRLSPNASPNRCTSDEPRPEIVHEDDRIAQKRENFLTKQRSLSAPTIENLDSIVSGSESSRRKNQKTLETQRSNPETVRPEVESSTQSSNQKSPGPFSLNVTSNVNKSESSLVTETPTKALQLDKSAVTKATKNDLLPINQLTRMPSLTRDEIQTKGVSAKELRRTSRKLKSEFRTFGDGIVNTPREEKRAYDMKNQVFNSKLNGHYSAGKDSLRRSQKLQMEDVDVNKENRYSSSRSNSNGNSNERIVRTSSNEPQRTCKQQVSVENLRSNSTDGSSTHDPYSTMMSQEESYV